MILSHTEKFLNKSNLINKEERQISTSKLIELCQGYGLTKNQAKLIDTLTQPNGCLTVKQISRESNVPRESIYNILQSLIEMGFVEKTLSKPQKFCTIPLKTILSVLRHKKNQENHELEKLTTQVLIENQQKSKNNLITNETHFYLIPKKKQLLSKVSRAISNSKKSISVITSWKRHLQAMINYEKPIKKAINKGVKINVFITKKPRQDKIPETARFFHNSPNVSIKFVKTPTKIVAIIIDQQEVFLITKPHSDLIESAALWSDNPSLITALTTCFEICWKK